MTDNTLPVLLSYGARGFKIFPTRNKAPLIKGGHGFKDASGDPRQITQWFNDYPGCQWAVATGEVSGISVVDLDVKHGGDVELERLLSAYDEPIPNTLTARSGGGGTHFYFQAVPGLASSDSRVGDGIDIKSEGGACTLPPSIHHETGARYRWLNDVEPQPMPKWIRALAQRTYSKQEEREAARRAEEAQERYRHNGIDEASRRYAQAAFDDGMRAIETAGEGRRRNTLNAETYSLAQLVGAGLLERAMVEEGAKAAALRAGLTLREVNGTIRAAMLDGMGQPRAPRLDRSRREAPRQYTNGHDLRPEEPPPASEADYGTPRAEKPQEEQVPETGPKIELLDVSPFDKELPPREWILGRSYCRGFLHGLVGAGAAGKTSLRILQLLSVASGKQLSGEEVHVAGKVLMLCFEDDRNEIERRIRAAVTLHRLDEEDVIGMFRFVIVKGLSLADARNDGRAVPGALYRELDRILAEEKPIVVTIEPLAGSHTLKENETDQMVALAQMLGDLASRHNCAVDFTHHTRKGPGEAGDVDRSRGAVALINHSRIVHMLSVMSLDDARALGLPEKERRSYVRVDDGKVNIAVQGTEARWFKLSSVRLTNGDSVQAIAPWVPEKLFDNVSAADARAALIEIGRGLPDGRLYSQRFGADNAAWRAVQRIFSERTEQQCQGMVEQWLNTGALFVDDYKDPDTRKKKRGLKLNAANLPTATPHWNASEPELPVDL